MNFKRAVVSNETQLPRRNGYAAYHQIGRGCWSHSERCSSEAVQLDPQDPVATAIVARIDELFAIDAQARPQVLSQEARHALRQQHSRPQLGAIRAQITRSRFGTSSCASWNIPNWS